MTEATEPVLRLPSRVGDRGVNLLAEGRALLKKMRSETEKLNSVPGAGLGEILGGFWNQGGGAYGVQDTAAMPYTLANANSYSPITLNRIELSVSYVNQGLIRTAIDQPVEDAFRGGVTFKSGQLDDKELQKLNRAFKRQRSRASFNRTQIGRVNIQAGYDLANSDLTACKFAMKWARLFGGAGLIINTNQDFRSELDVDRINEDSPLTFIAADRWEMLMNNVNIWDESTPTPFNYYGLDLNRTRVLKIMGDEAPSWYRLRLQGWGMSLLEQCMRAISAFIKFERLLFELMDEAKIDVYKMDGYNALLASAAGTEAVRQRIWLANQLKNFQTAITMDVKDEYEQKTLGTIFPGLAQIWQELRLNLCAYLKMPLNKLFGQSASGFSSGKDSQDNYNSTLGTIREKADPLVEEVGALRCQQMFGFVPDDLDHEWQPLGVLDGVEEEQVKTSKQARTLAQFQAGLLNGQEASEALKKEELLLVESEVLLGVREATPPLSENPDEADAARKGQVDLVKAKAGAKPAGGE